MDIVIALTAAAPMVTIFSLCLRNTHGRLGGLRSPEPVTAPMARAA